MKMNEQERFEFFKSHPNAERIYAQGTLVVRAKIPARVRKELSEAVKAGLIGRIAKDGLYPEVYYDPRHTGLAREIRANEAVYAVECVRKCVA